jgi:hypothetical protein
MFEMFEMCLLTNGLMWLKEQQQMNKFRALTSYCLKKETKRIIYFFARIFVKIHHGFLRKFSA